MWFHEHSAFTVIQLPALQDNYVYLICPHGEARCLVVDPSEAVPVMQACTELGLRPTHVLNTHHHWDHTGGNLDLQKAYSCAVVGAESDAKRIPGLDFPIDGEQRLTLSGLEIQVLAIPGHTQAHLAYVIEDALFSGDTLFGAGCGRIFEGTPEQMWASLKHLASLPGATRIYCAHEYTLANLAFAETVDSDNPALKPRIRRERQRRAHGKPTIPSTIKEELNTNPFLRPMDPNFRRRYARRNQIQESELDVFSDLRAKKDRF